MRFALCGPAVFSLSIAAAAPAFADPATLGFLPSTVQPSDLFGLPVDRWFVELNQTSAFTAMDSVTDTRGLSYFAPNSAQLNLASESMQTLLSRQATARATTTATTLGTWASAVDALDAHSSFTASGAYAIQAYWAVLSDPTPVRFKLNLKGSLHVTGSRVGGEDSSAAAVAMYAQGSLNELNPDYSQPFKNIGVDTNTEGDALLA